MNNGTSSYDFLNDCKSVSLVRYYEQRPHHLAVLREQVDCLLLSR